ncbi:MAG: cupin domain-containing protein [Calditrichaceae bacterium]
MKNYFKQSNPFRVPTEDDKIIDEHFGRASTGEKGYSIAHMIAPPGWNEPHQSPEFDEITLMISGSKMIEIDGETIELMTGESIYIKKGARVRYSNPFNEPADYISICLPAFSPELVHREE